MTVISVERVRLTEVAIEDIESRPDYLSRWASGVVLVLALFSTSGAGYNSFV